MTGFVSVIDSRIIGRRLFGIDGFLVRIRVETFYTNCRSYFAKKDNLQSCLDICEVFRNIIGNYC